jgi:hypothetical protein
MINLIIFYTLSKIINIIIIIMIKNIIIIIIVNIISCVAQNRLFDKKKITSISFIKFISIQITTSFRIIIYIIIIKIIVSI